MAALAIPFAVVEGAAIATAAEAPIISGIGSFINSTLAFVGAGSILNDVIKAVEPAPQPPTIKLSQPSQQQLNALSQMNNDPLKLGQTPSNIHFKSPLNRF
jgi:hypothetical protein